MKNKTCGECKYFEVDVVAATCEKKLWIFDDNSSACKKFEPKTLTNGDLIRQGGNRELAECCVYEVGNMFASTLISDKTFETYEDAVDAAESWLNAPADCVAKNEKSAKQPDLCCKSEK